MKVLTRPGVLALAGCFALPGCLATVGPDYQSPGLAAPDTYSTPAALAAASAAPAPTTAAGTADTALWWHGYGDPLLDALVGRALAGNLDVAAAGARLAEARALVDVARAVGGPSLDADVNADVDTRVAGIRRGSDTEGSADAGLAFSWMPDLFGGQRRRVEAAEAELRRRALLRDDLARTTVADVVRRYLEIRRDGTRLRLIAASLASQDHTIVLVRRRFDVGLATRLDVSRAEALAAATRASRRPIERDLAAARAALAVLTGVAPGPVIPEAQTKAQSQTQIEAQTESSVPAYRGGPPLGLPLDLLRNRPDVRAAEADLARATAAIGVAEAELYPALTLPGRLTASATGIGTGNVVESLIAAVAVTLDIPLFDSGGRRATLAAAEARALETLLVYRASLLDALADAETALAGLIAARARRAELQAAVDASIIAYNQAQQLYSQGLVDFLDVLVGERTLLQNGQSLADAAADVALAITDLYSAIGAPVTATL